MGNKRSDNDSTISIRVRDGLILAGVFVGVFAAFALVILPKLMYDYERKFPVNVGFVTKQYLDLKQYSKAEQAYLKAIDSFGGGVVDMPNLLRSHYSLANVYIEREEYDKAIGELLSFAELSPAQMNLLPVFPSVYLNIAKCYLKTDDLDRATLYFKIAYDIDPSMKIQIMALSLQYIRDNKATSEPILKVCELLCHMKDYDSAQLILKDFRKDPLARSKLMGKSHYYKKSYNRSAFFFEQVISEDPQCFSAYFFLHSALEKLKRFDQLSVSATSMYSRFKMIDDYTSLKFSSGTRDDRAGAWRLNKTGHCEWVFSSDELKDGKFWIVLKSDSVIDVHSIVSVRLNDREIAQLYVATDEFLPYEIDLSGIGIPEDSVQELKVSFYFINNAYSQALFEDRQLYVQSIYALL